MTSPVSSGEGNGSACFGDPAERNRADAQHRLRAAQSEAHTDGSLAPDEGGFDGSPSGIVAAGMTPMESAPARRRAIPVAAAGISAIAETLRVGVGEMGIRRTVTSYLRVNQKDGFDCQSCAWPSPNGTRHIAEFCENGAKAIASEGTRKRADAAFFAKSSIADLLERSDAWLHDQGRLTEPLVRRRGATHYVPISWPDAFALLAQELAALSSPNDATFYTSGRTSNEAAFLYGLFVRQFGTNNLPDCSNMCHESSGAALVESIGVGKSTVQFEDFDRCDTIVIIGQNPGTNHPRMLTALERAKRNGATIVSINPLPEVGLMRVRNPNPQAARSPLRFLPDLVGPGAPLSDLHLAVRVNGDVALLNGIMKAMLELERARPGSVLDRAFIEHHTTGFDALAADLAEADWDQIVASSGVSFDEITAAAKVLAKAERMIACWAMGLTQHRNGVDNVRAVVNLLLLGGHIGRPGAGVCCVRGHSNVQGDRTMGIWERMDAGFLDALEEEFNFASPREDGLDSVDSIVAMHEGRVRVFVAMGGNLLSAGPDTAYTAQAMQRCSLTVQVSTKLNRNHLITGEQALILPCLGRSERDRRRAGEQFVTVEDSLGVISASRGVHEPASEHLLSEPAIVAGMAKTALAGRSTVDWDALAADYGRIRDHIARVVPGFEDFNERIGRDVFALPNAARQRDFETSTGRANFGVTTIPVHHLGPDQLLLTTLRSHDQFNTTVYGLNDRYRGVFGGRRVIFLNRADMSTIGAADGDTVDVTSHFNGQTRTMLRVQVVAFDIAPRSAAMYFPEANALVPIGSVARESNTPTSKSIPITVTRSAA